MHDLRARADDGLGLLAAKHGARDLRRVGEVRELRLLDPHPGELHARLQLRAQGVGHRVGAAAERDLVGVVLLALVVVVARGHVAQRRFALHAHEVLEVVDVEERLRRVLHAPDDHGRDLDGVAALVVHLERLDVVVARAHAHLLAQVPGEGPAKARRALGADVVPEEREHGALVGLQREEAGHHEGDEEAADQQRDGRAHDSDEVDLDRDGRDEHRQHEDAVEGGRGLLEGAGLAEFVHGVPPGGSY